MVYLLGRIVDSGRKIVGFDLTEVVPDFDDKMCIELFNIAKASIEVNDDLEAIDESLDEWEVSEESYEYVS